MIESRNSAQHGYQGKNDCNQSHNNNPDHVLIVPGSSGAPAALFPKVKLPIVHIRYPLADDSAGAS